MCDEPLESAVLIVKPLELKVASPLSRKLPLALSSFAIAVKEPSTVMLALISILRPACSSRLPPSLLPLASMALSIVISLLAFKITSLVKAETRSEVLIPKSSPLATILLPENVAPVATSLAFAVVPAQELPQSGESAT